MSRLIDADVLVKRICGEKCGCTKNQCGDDICEAVAMVYEIPTVYDVDKVAERLRQADENAYIHNYGQGLSIEEVIEIVRKGGVNE